MDSKGSRLVTVMAMAAVFEGEDKWIQLGCTAVWYMYSEGCMQYIRIRLHRALENC